MGISNPLRMHTLSMALFRYNTVLIVPRNTLLLGNRKNCGKLCPVHRDLYNHQKKLFLLINFCHYCDKAAMHVRISVETGLSLLTRMTY